MSSINEPQVYYSLLSPERQGQLQEIARAAEQACVEQPHFATPHLIDVLHAAGYDPQPMAPEPDGWDDPKAWEGIDDRTRFCPTCGTALGEDDAPEDLEH